MNSSADESDIIAPGGGLRWPATVLAVISAVLAVLTLARIMSPPAGLWPPLVIVLLVCSILFWTVIAFVQWRLWRGQGPSAQSIWAASVYRREDELIVHPQNRTWNNVGWNSEPVMTIAVGAPRESIGEAVRRALLSSRCDARTADPVELDNPILKIAGVTTWEEFNRGARYASVALENGQITVYRYRAARGSEGKGFIQLQDGHVTFSPDSSDGQLAAAVLDALQVE
jgi:hypothetical protein